MRETEKSMLELLESLRYIALQGLHYRTGDIHDIERYEKLLALSAESYAPLLDLPAPEIINTLRQELGHITPKVGVDAAVFNERGDVFLVKRKDDLCWCLPCGWCDVNESPEQALVREFKEEVGLVVQPKKLLNVFTRLPGDYGALFTSYHMIYLCEDMPARMMNERVLQPEEIIDAGWFSDEQLSQDFDWHRDHKRFFTEAKNARYKKSSVEIKDT